MNDTATMTIKQTAEEFARARQRHDWREIAGEWFEAPVRRWIGTLDADGEPEDDTGDAVILAVGMREFLALRDVMLVAAIRGERADFTADRAIGFLRRPMMRDNVRWMEDMPAETFHGSQAPDRRRCMKAVDLLLALIGRLDGGDDGWGRNPMRPSRTSCGGSATDAPCPWPSAPSPATGNASSPSSWPALSTAASTRTARTPDGGRSGRPPHRGWPEPPRAVMAAGSTPRHTASRVPCRRAGGDVSAAPSRTSLTAGSPMSPDLRETRGPGPEGPGHASDGTARRRAAIQWFFFFAGRPGPWIISASRNPSNPPRTVPRARGVAFDGTRPRPMTLRVTNRPKRKDQGRDRIPARRKEREMSGFLNLPTPDDRAELVGDILLLIVIAIPTAVVNAGRIRRRITRTWRILGKGASATRIIVGRAGIR